MHFFRGTGISGLRGMLPRQDRVIRPLLFASKEALMNYAVSKELTWVEDSSNTGDYYSRNYFRHQVIPLVSKIFPEALGNLSGNLSRFREIELLYNQSIQRHKKRLLSRKGEEIHIPVLKLRQSEPLSTIIYEIIREYGFTSSQTGEVMDLLEKDTGKYILSPEYRIIKNRNWLIIAPRNTELAETILIEEGQKHVQGPGFRIELSLFSAGQSALSTERSIAQIDAGEISFPLILRKWKPGDYFYPLGMRKKKKIARFLIDNKLSLLNKEKTWVIEANRKIIWIVGMRIDDRFRVTARTEKVLNIEMRVT
jgi:tRNA(Ile)-lysidine synthase